MKRCPKCKTVKDDSAFGKRGPCRPGQLKSHCRKCEAARQLVRARANPEGTREKYRKWYYKDVKETNRKTRARYALNPEPHRASHRKSNKKHGFSQKQYKNDPDFRVLARLRSRQGGEIRRAGGRKIASTMALTGCSLPELKAHFETLYKPGMTWENKGSVWHIDHIKPCAKFDLRDPEQQKSCFHWSNLQPLFAKENLQKGDSWAEIK